MASDPLAEAAYRIVRMVRRVADHRPEYQPADAADFPDHDAAFYDGLAQELAGMGAHLLGDYEDAAYNRTATRKAFYRLALSGDGTACASWFALPGEQGPRCLVVHSWLPDGTAIVTSRGALDDGMPRPSWYDLERYEGGLETLALLQAHGRRLAGRSAPRVLRDATDAIGALADEERRAAEFRAAQGPTLIEPMLRSKMTPDDFAMRGHVFLAAIAAHPEWWTNPDAPPPAEPERDARYTHDVTATLWEPIEPIDRGERYEDPLQAALEPDELGVVTGGGSQLTDEGEIANVDLDLSLANLDAALELAKRVLEEAGAPRGSELRFERDGRQVVVPFGTREGLAIYLDGVDLPDSVYAECSLDELAEHIAAALGGDGEIRGSWGGPRATSLYLYGPDAEAMFTRLQPVFASYPLCQNARVVIRHGNPALGPRTVRLPRHA